MLINVSKRTIGPKPLVLHRHFMSWMTFGFAVDDRIELRAAVLRYAKAQEPNLDLKAAQ